MACFLIDRQDTSLCIPRIEQTENYTLYCIIVKVGVVSWSVKHRYSDFLDMHEKLVSDHGIAKDILPPKKVIGNMDPVFVEKRRASLEHYLQIVFNMLQRAMPRELALFLNFHLYDIIFLLQSMAIQFYEEGDELLEATKSYTLTPIQLHAISQRLKQPCPPLEILDKRQDFSHVLDFCSQLETLNIRGGNFYIGTSNIVHNRLQFELSPFKFLKKLNMFSVSVENIYHIGTIRETVTTLTINSSQVKRIAHVLLCDSVHKDVINVSESLIWRYVVEADFSQNEIEVIDEAVKLMPNLERLILNDNKLCALQNLTSLPQLSHLCLSANYFTTVENLHTKLGNILLIDLSQNSITSLQGFSRLFSLVSLNVGSNKISNMQEICYISSLPCLENVILTGNPLATVVDYRTKVLEQFGSRVGEICLDNEKPTQKELDTVAVLQAIRIVKEGRSPAFGSESSLYLPSP